MGHIEGSGYSVDSRGPDAMSNHFNEPMEEFATVQEGIRDCLRIASKNNYRTPLRLFVLDAKGNVVIQAKGRKTVLAVIGFNPLLRWAKRS
jgi:hypothetical protein